MPSTRPWRCACWDCIEFQRGHLETATARFAELLQSGKYADDAFYYLALIADRSDDPEHALRLYAQVQSGDNALPALLRAAKLLQNHGRRRHPRNCSTGWSRTSRNARPRSSPRAPASTPMRTNSRPGAIATLLNRASPIIRTMSDLRYAMASTHEEMGRIPAALRELDAIMKSRPDDPAALECAGLYARRSLARPRSARGADRTSPCRVAKKCRDSRQHGLGVVPPRPPAEAETYLKIAYADDRGGDIAAASRRSLVALGRTGDARQIWAEASAVDPENRLSRKRGIDWTSRSAATAAPVPGPIPPLRPVPTTGLAPAKRPLNAAAIRLAAPVAQGIELMRRLLTDLGYDLADCAARRMRGDRPAAMPPIAAAAWDQRVGRPAALAFMAARRPRGGGRRDSGLAGQLDWRQSKARRRRCICRVR